DVWVALAESEEGEAAQQEETPEHGRGPGYQRIESAKVAGPRHRANSNRCREPVDGIAAEVRADANDHRQANCALNQQRSDGRSEPKAPAAKHGENPVLGAKSRIEPGTGENQPVHCTESRNHN